MPRTTCKCNKSACEQPTQPHRFNWFAFFASFGMPHAYINHQWWKEAIKVGAKFTCLQSHERTSGCLGGSSYLKAEWRSDSTQGSIGAIRPNKKFLGKIRLEGTRRPANSSTARDRFQDHSCIACTAPTIQSFCKDRSMMISRKWLFSLHHQCDRRYEQYESEEKSNRNDSFAMLMVDSY